MAKCGAQFAMCKTLLVRYSKYFWNKIHKKSSLTTVAAVVLHNILLKLDDVEADFQLPRDELEYLQKSRYMELEEYDEPSSEIERNRSILMEKIWAMRTK